MSIISADSFHKSLRRHKLLVIAEQYYCNIVNNLIFRFSLGSKTFAEVIRCQDSCETLYSCLTADGFFLHCLRPYSFLSLLIDIVHYVMVSEREENRNRIIIVGTKADQNCSQTSNVSLFFNSKDRAS